MPSSRNNNERLALPTVVHPAKTICFQIEIPDDRGYLAAFYGAIGQLAQWRTWAYDDFHTAKEVAAVWRAIYFSLDAGNCTARSGNAGADGDELMIRQNPDNPCLLESSVDGITWCAWADISKCVLATGIQPAGGGQPDAGSCSQYDVTLNGRDQWLLPFQVSEGDTVELSHLAGAWNDGTLIWYCPQGTHFVLNACGAAVPGFVTDPMPSANHMAVIGFDGTNYYDLTLGLVTILPGITLQNFVIMANDQTPNDNNGTIGFHAKACVNPSAPNSITYLAGSGPTAFNYGDVVNMTPQDMGGGDFNLTFETNVPVKLYILSAPGYVFTGASGNVFMQWFNPPGTLLAQQTNPPNTSPTQFPNGTTVMEWSAETGAGSASWTCQVRLDHP